MKILILYDSVYGNTQQIAMAISKSISSGIKAEAVHIKDVMPGQLTGLDILIVGSPTQAFRPTKTVTEFLDKIPPNGLKGIKVAAFDTRISLNDVDSRFLKVMVKLFGYAASPISIRLKKKGGKLVIPPEGFLVNKTEGPLKEGEIERAAEWGSSIAKI
jgi:flavodoxin I